MVVVGTSEGLVSVVVVPGVTVWEELDVEGMSVGGTSEKLDGELVLVSEELDEVGGSEVCGNGLVVAAGVEDGASPPPRIPVKRPPRSEVSPPRVSPRRPPLVVTGAGVGEAVSLPPRRAGTTSPRSEVTPSRAPPRSSRRPPLRAVGSVMKLSR